MIAGKRKWAVECGECVDVLRRLPEQSVDTIVTDPPFVAITHYQSTTSKQQSWADMSLLAHGWATICNEAKRVLKPDGHIAVFSNASSYPLFWGAMYDRWHRLGCLVWDKIAPGLGNVWRRQHELIIIARDSGAWTPKDGKTRPDVLRHKITPSKRRTHPIHKPPGLLAEVIEATCPRDGIVLDPFLGSGTTGEAALLAERRFIGVEMDPRYARAADSLVRRSARQARQQQSRAKHDPRRKTSTQQEAGTRQARKATR